MKKVSIISSVLVLVVLSGCAATPKTAESKDILALRVKGAIAQFKAEDSGIQTYFDSSYGYAVLPKVLKGAFVIGGAGGKGQVFQYGRMIGYCSLTQATFGFSFGGEYFREIIFFRDKRDLDKFMSEEFTFSAQATAVALTKGAAAKADYKDGMAVFLMTDKGLMIDASIGGQKFKYSPK
jgi:lipid-binding SYLF domain-containing protein